MPEFMELAPCPSCEGVVHVRYDDEGARLECEHCGRKFGAGSPQEEARVLCMYWNLLLGDQKVCSNSE